MSAKEQIVYLTSEEVSKILGVSRQTLLKLRKKGALEGFSKEGKIGILYDAEAVKTLLQARTTITKLPSGVQQ